MRRGGMGNHRTPLVWFLWQRAGLAQFLVWIRVSSCRFPHQRSQCLLVIVTTIRSPTPCPPPPSSSAGGCQACPIHCGWPSSLPAWTLWLAFLSPSMDMSRELFLMPLGRPRSRRGAWWSEHGFRSQISFAVSPSLTSQCLGPPRLWNWKGSDHPGALPLGRED